MFRTSLGAVVAAALIASASHAELFGARVDGLSAGGAPALFQPGLMVATADTHSGPVGVSLASDLLVAGFGPGAPQAALLESPSSLVRLADWPDALIDIDATLATLGEAAPMPFIGF